MSGIVIDPASLEAWCPSCGAEPGYYCMSGGYVAQTHRARVTSATEHLEARKSCGFDVIQRFCFRDGRIEHHPVENGRPTWQLRDRQGNRIIKRTFERREVISGRLTRIEYVETPAPDAVPA